MKIKFSKHAEIDKFAEFKQHGLIFTKLDVTKVIKNPDHIDKESDAPKIIASKDFDEKHILRVVYIIESGIIKVITFYPAEKGRYYR